MALGQEGAKEYLAEIGLARHEDLMQVGEPGDRPTLVSTDLTGWDYQTDVIDPRRPAQKRKRKGTKGITSYGTKTVRSACHVMQRYFGKNRLGFLTLTVPDHPDYLAVWCEQWAEIIRKFNQELQRELERTEAPTYVVAVTEIQTKRSKTVGFPVPHLHACFVAWDGKSYIKGAKTKSGKRMPAYYISHGRMQEIFARILANEIESVLEIVCNISEINPRVEVKPVKKSAEGYLGKYMSKGGKDVAKFTKEDPKRTDLPTHWWHCTKSLRTILKGLITELPPALLEALLTQMEDLKSLGIIQYARAITKEINGIERLLGWVCRFAPEYNPTDQNAIIQAFSTS